MSTAKNIVEILPREQYRISNIRTLGIDAPREFGATVEACLLVMNLGASAREQVCQVATLENSNHVTRVFGWVGDRFVSNVAAYQSNRELDGKSPRVWRQGLKHDCASIMELQVNGDTLENGNGELVQVEKEHLYWLLKSSDLRGFEAAAPRKKVIVTQSRLGEDTSALRVVAPKLWKYLNENDKYFAKRKSRIYRGKPRFSIFGVGRYSFEQYKVAISGLYKEPNFALVCPIENRPVMLDDTCYFLGFDRYLDALFTASLLNTAHVKRFLHAIAFADAKRPYTKEVLMRINLTRAVQALSLQVLQSYWANSGYAPRSPPSDLDLENYKASFPKTDSVQSAFEFAEQFVG